MKKVINLIIIELVVDHWLTLGIHQTFQNQVQLPDLLLPRVLKDKK